MGALVFGGNEAWSEIYTHTSTLFIPLLRTLLGSIDRSSLDPIKAREIEEGGIERGIEIKRTPSQTTFPSKRKRLPL